MTAAVLIFVCVVALSIAGDTPFGRVLHRALVEMPASMLNRIECNQIILVLVITVLIVMHLSLADSDPIHMLTLFAPNIAIALSYMEIGTIVEATITLSIPLSAVGSASFACLLTAIWRQPSKHRKNQTIRARKGPRRSRVLPANDDEVGARLALAS